MRCIDIFVKNIFFSYTTVYIYAYMPNKQMIMHHFLQIYPNIHFCQICKWLQKTSFSFELMHTCKLLVISTNEYANFLQIYPNLHICQICKLLCKFPFHDSCIYANDILSQLMNMHIFFIFLPIQEYSPELNTISRKEKKSMHNDGGVTITNIKKNRDSSYDEYNDRNNAAPPIAHQPPPRYGMRYKFDNLIFDDIYWFICICIFKKVELLFNVDFFRGLFWYIWMQNYGLRNFSFVSYPFLLVLCPWLSEKTIFKLYKFGLFRFRKES